MYPRFSSARFSLPSLLLVAMAWPLHAQSVVVLPNSATTTSGATGFPFTNTITGDFSNGGQIISGTTTLSEALTFGILPYGGTDSHGLGRFEPNQLPAGAPVTYSFSVPRDLSGILLWNYNEIYAGVLYNERGLTRADITVTHTGGTTVFNDVAFTTVPEGGGATQLAAAQQFNFGSEITGVVQVVFSDLQGTETFRGWMDFAAIQPSPTVPLVQKHWDGSNSDGNANGGTGTWDTIATNWDNAETGGVDVSWTQGGNAVFKGSFNGFVTLGEPITANTIIFDRAGYVISGNSLTIAGPQATVIANENATISSALGGSATVLKSGAGLLTLNGDGSAFTGRVSNMGGTLNVTSPNWSSASFSAIAGTVNFDAAGTITVKSVTLDNELRINNGTRLDIAGGHLIQVGGGGSVATAVGTPGSMTSSGGTLTLDSSIPGIQTIGVTLADASGTTPLALVLDGPGGGLIGDIVLSVANTYTGGTRLDSGRLNAQNAASLGTGLVAINQGGQAYLTTAGPFLNDFTLSGTGWQETAGLLGALRLTNTTVSGDVTVEASGARIVGSAGNTGILSGSLLGSGNLEINVAANASANGTVSFTGDGSAYSGTVTVAGGRLNVAGTLGSSATVVVGDAGTLGGEGSIANDLKFGVSGGATQAVDTTTPGTLSAADVTLNGVSNLAIQGAFTSGVPIPFLRYTGTLNDANGGNLSDSFNAVGYRAPVVSDNSGTLQVTITTENISWTGTTNGTWEIGGPSANWNSSNGFFNTGDTVTFGDTASTGAITITGTPQPSSVIFNNTSQLAYTLTGGAIGGSGGITKNNAGSVILGTPLTLTGNVVVNGGVLRFNNTARNVAGVTVNVGGTLETGATNLFVLNHNAAMANSRVITVDGGRWLLTTAHDGRFGNVVLSNGATMVSDRGVGAYDALMANTDVGPATLSVTGTGASVMEGVGGIHLQGVQNFNVADVTANPNADLTVTMVLAGPGTTAGAAGGVNKTGAGTMLLNGANTYAGATTVAAGTLGGTGSVTSAVTVNAGATLAPGVAVGTFSVTGNVAVSGSLAIDVETAAADLLAVTGTLDLTGGTLVFRQLSAPTQETYVIASATTITGTPTITGVPAGYAVEVTGTQITLKQSGPGPGSPFANWIDSFTNLVEPSDKFAEADPDDDGLNNIAEFALNGDPTDAADNGKVFMVKGDGADAGSASQLVLTLAVRTGAAFGNSASPQASVEGVTYTVQGSLDLSSFTAPVSKLPTPLLPPAPPVLGTDWEWRSFSLDGSSNFPGKGFMRVGVTSP